MLEVTIGGNRHKLKNEAKDITLKEYLSIYPTLNKAPKKLIDLYKSYSDENQQAPELTEKDELTILKYYEKVFRCFCDTDKPLDKQSVEEIYNTYLTHFVYSTLFGITTQSYKPLNQFKLDGVTYKLPERYMKNSVFGEFTNIEDAMTNPSMLDDYFEAKMVGESYIDIEKGNIKSYPFMLAVMYQEGKRSYDDNEIKERANIFMGLSMDVVWGCEAFFLMLQKKYDLLMTYYGGSLGKTRKQRRRLKKVLTRLDGLTQHESLQKKGILTALGSTLSPVSRMHRFMKHYPT